MDSDSPHLNRATDEIAREMAQMHQASYGRPVANLQVAVHDAFVAVVAEVELTPAEEVLARAGNGDAVRITREEFADAVRANYEAIVERATGRRVKAFASRVAVESDRPWSAEIFLLAPPAAKRDMAGE